MADRPRNNVRGYPTKGRVKLTVGEVAAVANEPTVMLEGDVAKAAGQGETTADPRRAKGRQLINKIN